jgi:hypothetical protein
VARGGERRAGRRRAGRPALARQLALLGLALAAGAPPAEAAHARGEELLPVQEHASPEAQVLAEAYRTDLATVLTDLGRCEADLDVHRHGIGFRRPRGVDGARPHLVAWVWLDRARPPAGADLPARAGDAFARAGWRLFRRLLTRPAVEADPRLGGYGIVLTWFPPGRGDTPIGESLVVFADRAATARFVRDGEPAARFLDRAGIRYFDGQTPVQAPPPRPPDVPVQPAVDGC